MGLPIWLKASLVAWAATVALCGSVPSAEACTCSQDRTRLVVPTADAPLPEGAPLLLYADPESLADTLLVDGAGESLPLASELVLPGLGLCSNYVVVLRPESPLVPGQTYTVRPADARWNASMYAAEKSRSFRVSSSTPESRPRVLTVSAVEEDVEDRVSSSASCSDPLLDGQLVTSYATVTVQANAPVLAMLSVSVDDPVVGRYSDVDATLVGARGTDWEFEEIIDTAVVEIPLLESSSRCLQVEVYEWTGTLLVAETVCVERGEPSTTTHSVDVAVSPLESGESDDDGDSSGCSCAMPRRTHTRTCWALLLLLAPFVRRGRR